HREEGFVTLSAWGMSAKIEVKEDMYNYRNESIKAVVPTGKRFSGEPGGFQYRSQSHDQPEKDRGVSWNADFHRRKHSQWHPLLQKGDQGASAESRGGTGLSEKPRLPGCETGAEQSDWCGSF